MKFPVSSSSRNCLVEEGSHGFLQSRFAVIFGLLSSTQLFEFFRTVLDEIISSEEGWLFCIFCAVPLLFLDPSSIVAMKGQRKRPLNILEEVRVFS